MYTKPEKGGLKLKVQRKFKASTRRRRKATKAAQMEFNQFVSQWEERGPREGGTSVV